MCSQVFRQRKLQCHQSANPINDRSSYTVRRVSELDVLSTIGTVVNVRGVTQFVKCKSTRTTWLHEIDRALLERHLARSLQFSPSLQDTCKHFKNDPLDVTVREELDDYKTLIHYTVFALMQEVLEEIVVRPERLARIIYCARQKALPMLVSWLLGENTQDCSLFKQLMLVYKTQHKVLDQLRLSVRREMEETREFITDFLCALEKQTFDAGTPTHIPETFLCDGGDNIFERDALSLDEELYELLISYDKTHDSTMVSTRKDILDPSLRCRIYCDDQDTENGKTNYQWLPTEFQTGVDGDVTVLSPLHGSVHPHQFPRLYAAVPKILGRLLPLFERVLGSIATQDPPTPYQVGLGSTHSKVTVTEKYTKPHTPSKQFYLRDRQLQVVVKLSTIQLDAAHPTFVGERDHEHYNRGWQLDSDDHEQIVAIGYHVLHSRNISSPKFAFRAFAHELATLEEPGLMSQEDTFLAFGERTSAFYDGRYGKQFLQPWGSLTLHEGRSIVVPSFLTHRMDPFTLLDATDSKGGELTIATFYLVDPTHTPIASTRTVRPEQWQQTRCFVQANVDMLRCSSMIPYLPHELTNQIADFAASNVSDHQAQFSRQQLLNQRQKLQELRFMTPSLRLEEMTLDL